MLNKLCNGGDMEVFEWRIEESECMGGTDHVRVYLNYKWGEMLIVENGRGQYIRHHFASWGPMEKNAFIDSIADELERGQVIMHRFSTMCHFNLDESVELLKACIDPRNQEALDMANEIIVFTVDDWLDEVSKIRALGVELMHNCIVMDFPHELVRIIRYVRKQLLPKLQNRLS